MPEATAPRRPARPADPPAPMQRYRALVTLVYPADRREYEARLRDHSAPITAWKKVIAGDIIEPGDLPPEVVRGQLGKNRIAAID